MVSDAEAEQLLRKYDARTLAPLAVNCGLVRLLKEREEAIQKAFLSKQMTFDWGQALNV